MSSKRSKDKTAGTHIHAALKGDHWQYGLGMALTNGCDWEKIAAAFGLDIQAPTADRDRCGLALEGGRDTRRVVECGKNGDTVLESPLLFVYRFTCTDMNHSGLPQS